MTTHDPASPVAAALADAAEAERYTDRVIADAGYAMIPTYRALRADVAALVAHIRTLAARDAERQRREDEAVPEWAIIEGYQPGDTYDDWYRRECAGLGPDELR